MSHSAHRLVEGPAGRRMLLEFAVRGEALASADVTTELPLWKALFDHRVTSGSGIQVQGWGAEHVPAPTTPEALASLLGSVPLVRARPTLLLDALQRSATAQALDVPDDVDHLLASWRLEPALLRVAEQVVATGTVGWWGRPLARKAQVVVDPGRRSRKARRGSPEPLGSAPVDRPVTSRGWPRRGPVAGLLGAGEPVTGRTVGRRADVPRKARVLEVGGADDWAELCRRYPRVVEGARAESWQRRTGWRGAWVQPDWKKVGKHHDAVHLSLLGWLSTSGAVVTLDDDRAGLLWGWAPEATHWLGGLPG